MKGTTCLPGGEEKYPSQKQTHDIRDRTDLEKRETSRSEASRSLIDRNTHPAEAVRQRRARVRQVRELGRSRMTTRNVHCDRHRLLRRLRVDVHDQSEGSRDVERRSVKSKWKRTEARQRLLLAMLRRCRGRLTRFPRVL